MRGSRFQRGEITPGCIIGLIVVVIAVVVAIKTVPVYMRVYEFQDEVTRIADKGNNIEWRDPKKMQQRLASKAQELRLPIPAEAIKVTRAEKYIEIKVSFDVELDYGVYQHVWHKDINQSRPLF